MIVTGSTPPNGRVCEWGLRLTCGNRFPPAVREVEKTERNQSNKVGYAD